MAMARWRTIRLWTYEKWTLDGKVRCDEPETATGVIPFETTMNFATTATARPELILRYETMYHSQFHRCLKQLLALQAKPMDGGTPVPASQDDAPPNEPSNPLKTNPVSSEAPATEATEPPTEPAEQALPSHIGASISGRGSLF
jgi:hypothetical protein